VAAANACSGKSSAGGKGVDAVPDAGAAALAVGDAGYCARCVFGFERALFQDFGCDVARVVGIERRKGAVCEHIIGREAGELVFGRKARHRDCTVDKRGNRVAREVGCRGGSRSFADEYPQTDFGALRAADIFQNAKPDRHIARCAGPVNNIGGIGTGTRGAGNQVSCAVERVVSGKHRSYLETACRSDNRAGKRHQQSGETIRSEFCKCVAAVRSG